MGDPAGVGPETIVGAWTNPPVHAGCRPLVVGHPEIIRRAVRLLNSPIEVVEIGSPDAANPSPGVLPCLRSGSDEAALVKPCVIDPRGGQAAYDALLLAAELAKSGLVDAITTAPLHKAALWQAGHHYPGHTELLAELCGVQDFAMMLYLGHDEHVRGKHGLAVVHVTLHMALKDVFANLSSDAILAKARLADGIMRRIMRAEKSAASSLLYPATPSRIRHGVAGYYESHANTLERAPRIGVCALNPHAGEEGLFGDEEQTIIRPAVERGRAEGLDLEGPLPADTLIVRARDGHFDAVVAMYHDQGHIALKLLGMHRAVNVTLGLPIVRTSVAHGTAFDLAWQGRAETSSMVEAIRVAALLAERPLIEH